MWFRLALVLGIICPVFLAQRTAVLILARGGSKGIRLKNLQDVGGITLLARAILTAKHAGFKDITVSTDHPLIALEALKYKVNIFKRSSATATDFAPSIWGLQEFLDARSNIDIVLLLQATSPFIQPIHLKQSVIKINYPTQYDCLFSVIRSFKLRWNTETNRPINFSTKKRPRRQDWKGEFIETGAFYIARTYLIREGYLQNNK